MDISLTAPPLSDVFDDMDLADPVAAPAEAPDSSAAPDPEAAASGVTSAPSDSEPAAGQPRDEQGRFAPKSGGPEEGQTPSADAPQAPADPSQPAPTPQDAPPAEPAPEPAPAPTLEPFAVRVHGRPHTIPGATIDPASRRIVIEPEGYDEAHRYLARGVEYHTVGRQREAEAQATIADLTERVSQKHAATEAIMSVVHLPEDEFIEAMLDFRAKLPELEKQQLAEENRKLREAMARGERGPADRMTAQQREAAPEAPSVLQQAQAAMQEAPAVAEHNLTGFLSREQGLSADDVQDIREHILANPERFLRRATEEDALTEDVQVGQIVFDGAAQQREVARLVRLARRGAEAAKTAAAAQQRNTAKLAPPPAPPVTARAVNAPPDEKPAEPQTMEEWKALYGL